MPFLSDVVPVAIQPDGTYVLTADVVYEGRDDVFVVPAGFSTDLASVPRLMSWLVPIAGVHDRAAIVHDWLCVQLEEERQAGARLIVAERHRASMRRTVRALAPANARDTDAIFRRILRELGVPLCRRWLFYVGVRWGALANPARRAGWWKDAPAVLAISAAALPFLLLPALFVGAALLIDNLLEALR